MAETSDQLLERLKAEIAYDKVTLSFSIEGRDHHGLKKYSCTTLSFGRAGGGTWTPGEMLLAKTLASKQLVATTYKDALLRGAVSATTYKHELPQTIEKLNKQIQVLLERHDGS